MKFKELFLKRLLPFTGAVLIGVMITGMFFTVVSPLTYLKNRAERIKEHNQNKRNFRNNHLRREINRLEQENSELRRQIAESGVFYYEGKADKKRKRKSCDKMKKIKEVNSY